MRRLIVCFIVSVLTIAANGVSAQGGLPPCPGLYNAATWTNCVGETTRPSGEKYVGEWRDGNYHGQGTLTFPDGRKSIGEFKDGKPNWQEQQQLAGQPRKSRQSIASEPPRQAPAGEAAPQVSGRDLAEQALAPLQLQAQIDKRKEEYQTRPRKQFIGARASEYRFARYEAEWRAKIVREGTLNCPDEARGRLYGNLKLTVTIRPDGTVESIELDRSSGLKVLDEAAFRIVKMAAPFAAFPAEIRRDTDLLVITRTWFFTQGDKIRAD